MSGTAATPEVALRAQALLQAAWVTGQARMDVILGGLALLLTLAAVRMAAGIARFVHTYYLRPAIHPRTFGPWAVVTGASEGIGRALSNLLAEKGVNIILVSLPEPRLHEAAAELEAKYRVKTRTVPIDLCRNVGPTTFATIRAALEGIQVGILVNCAGLYQPPAFLEELPDQRIQDMLVINSYVPTMLCKMVLPDMRARGRGLVVNIGSATASLMQEAPLLQGYAATKAYLDNLSRSLDAEYAPFGVRVQCIWAAFVATRMTPNLTPSAMCPGPAAWAAAAMRQFGRETVIDPYPLHALIMDVGFKLMPKISHRNTRRYSDEGRERVLRAAGKLVAPIQEQSHLPARNSSPRRRK